MAIALKNLDSRVRDAVAFYWQTLDKQSKKQRKKGARKVDRGLRAGVTGGKQMLGFAKLIQKFLIENNLPEANVHVDKLLELPGYFRPNKKWDLVVVRDNQLIAALELKSQASSFGKNFNNRVEEIVGTTQDLKTAFREGAFRKTGQKPWIGAIWLLADCPETRAPVGVEEPHFKVFPEFRDTSFAKRYELLLRRLVREELCTRAALLLSTIDDGPRGKFTEPAEDLRINDFFVSLAGHIGTFAATQS